MNAIADTIARRIRGKGRGWVFTPRDFLDVASRTAIDQTLSRLARKGMIRRLDRGLYDYPKQHDTLGTLSPSADDLAQALAKQTGNRVFPSGAAAANYLGLSTQVPARPVYLTNGASRTKKVAGRTITLKHAKVPIIHRLSDTANLLLQALSYLGQNGIDDKVIQQCAARLNDRDLRDLSKARARVPAWMADVILKIEHIKNGQLRQTA